jgi:mannose-6-phosphate isomerase-like protein (cupin superfamily)
MRRLSAVVILGVLAGLTGSSAQAPPAPAPPGIYKSAADIAAGLAKLGTSSTAATGADVAIAPGISVRRRSSGGEPQFAIIHPYSIEIYQIVEGTGTLVTGGALVPPFNVLNADIVRSQSIAGGEERRVGKGDVVVLNPGTPHWFKQIDGSITYLEARVRVRND